MVDPRRTATADAATIHLADPPGTDLALHQRLPAAAARLGQARSDATSPNHTEGWDELNALLDEYPPARVAEDRAASSSRISSPPPASSPITPEAA